MKKCLFLWAMALVMAGAVCSCSKSDDDGGNNAGIEKTYADDDFLMTERNIKEKLIGDWEITYLKKCDEVWVEYSAADLGALKDVTVRADGTGELFGLEGVHWSVADNVVTISSQYLVCSSSGLASHLSILLGNYDGYGMKRSDAEAYFNSIESGLTFSTELMETYKVKVRNMEKDFFDIYQIGERYNAQIRLKRK